MFLKTKKSITIISIIISLICFSLSIWQFKRLKWKEDLINSLEKAYISSPIQITDINENLKDFKYKKIISEGKFLNNKNMYLGPRVYKGQAGFKVMTPFVLKDGRIILTDRGWVREKKVYKEQKNLFVQGILKNYGERNFFTPKNEPKKNAWFYVDIVQMSEYVGYDLINDVILELINENDSNDYPIAKKPKVELSNNHLQYAATWFLLALVIIIMNFLYIKKNK